MFYPRDSQFIETKRPLATRQSLPKQHPTAVSHRDHLQNHPINVGNYTLYIYTHRDIYPIAIAIVYYIHNYIYTSLYPFVGCYSNLQNYNRLFNIAMETLHLQMIDHKFPYQTWITMCPRLSETTMSYSSSP